jgi:hypothetical protein
MFTAIIISDEEMGIFQAGKMTFLEKDLFGLKRLQSGIRNFVKFNLEKYHRSCVVPQVIREYL